MTIIKYLIALLISTTLFSQESDFKKFYYPINGEPKIKVFKYVDKYDPTNVEYWKVTTDPKAKTILTENYTSDFKKYNSFLEKYNSGGSQLIRYTDFDSQGDSIPSEIIHRDVYKWNDPNKYQYSVEYNRNDTLAKFTKTRIENGFQEITVKNKKYHTLRFLDEYKTSLPDHSLEYNFEQMSFYAEKIGMVEYRRYLPTGKIIELELHEILSEQEFKKLQAASR